VAGSLGEAVLSLSVDNAQFEAGLRAARSSADAAAGRIAQSFGGLTGVLRAIGGVAGVVGVAALTQQIAATGQEAQRAEIQLRSLSGAYGESAAAAESAARVQKVLGISSVAATEGLGQLYASLRGAGIGLNQLEVLFVGVSKAAALSGAGTAQAAAGLLQLKQGLASGRFQGDELASVLENIPVLAQAIAAQLKVNVGQVKKLGAEGKITSDIVFNAAKRLATASVPGKTDIEALGIAFQNVKAQAAAAFGPAFTSGLQTAAAGLIAFKTFLSENKLALGAVAQSILQIGRTLAPFVAGILAVQAAFKAWSIAAKAVSIAQAGVLALQGPKGWAVLTGAVLASAAAAAVLEKTLKKVGDATANAKEEASKAYSEFKKLLDNTNLEPTKVPPPSIAQDTAIQAASMAPLTDAANDIKTFTSSLGDSFESARQASDQLAKAQDSYRSALEGSFDLLTNDKQKGLLNAAKADLSRAVNAGIFDPSKVARLSGKELIGAAGQARSVVGARDELVNSNAQLVKATSELAKKNWQVNVAVNANTGNYAVDLG